MAWKNEINYSDMVTTQPQGAGPMEDRYFTIEELYQSFKVRMKREQEEEKKGITKSVPIKPLARVK